MSDTNDEVALVTGGSRGSASGSQAFAARRVGRLGTQEFVNEDGASQTARAGAVAVFQESNMVIDQCPFDGNRLGASHLGCHAEIQSVSSVVFDNQHCSECARDRLDGCENQINVRGRKHCSSDSRAKHTRANIACMRRLIPTAAAGDDSNLLVAVPWLPI
jgi:hypothetical protein